MLKISVIIPIYNAEKYLEKCLNNILNQSLKDIEILCINDGSTDNSYQILVEYSTKYNNIIIFEQENKGAGPARNKGIGAANGKYLCFMDADDYYADNLVLEKLYNHAEENNVSICGGNYCRLMPDGTLKTTRSMFSKKGKVLYKDYGNPFNYGCFIFLTKMIKDNNIIFPHYKRFQDPPFLTKAMIFAREFYALDIDIYIWRVGYKKVNFTREIAIDVLKGIRDCFLLAEENSLTKMYEIFLKNILLINLKVYCKYALSGDIEIWELINNINEINKRWMHHDSQIFLNRDSLILYVKAVEEEKQKLIKQCHISKKIIIYGAGSVANFVLDNYKHECQNIIGFAVSKEEENVRSIAGYKVLEIQKYLPDHKDALVIIATGKKYQEEIAKKLLSLKFEKICNINSTKLAMAEQIQK